jgi:hypothetical protein
MTEMVRLRGVHCTTRLPVVVIVPFWDVEWTKRLLDYRGYGEWTTLDSQPDTHLKESWKE